jgi:hypothetical protein
MEGHPTIIGDLCTRFTADTSDLKAGVEEYGKQIGDAEQATKKFDVASINLSAEINLIEKVFQYGKQALLSYTDAMYENYDSVLQFNRMTGTTVEMGGKWHDMFEQFGMDLSTATMGFRILSNNIEMALGDDSSKAAKAFKELGVTLVNNDGTVKDSNTLLLETVSALQKQEEGTKRNSLAMATMGRSYMAWNPILADSTDIVDRYNNTQTKMTKEGMKSFKDYKKSVDELNAAWDELKMGVGEKIIPAFTQLNNWITNNLIPAFNNLIDSAEYYGYLWKEIGQGKNNPEQRFTKEEYFAQKDIQREKEKEKDNSVIAPESEDAQKTAEKWVDDLTDAQKDYLAVIKEIKDEEKSIADQRRDYLMDVKFAGRDVSAIRSATMGYNKQVLSNQGKEEDLGGELKQAAFKVIATKNKDKDALSALSLNIQNVNLSKDYPIEKFIKDYENYMTTTKKQQGVRT